MDFAVLVPVIRLDGRLETVNGTAHQTSSHRFSLSTAARAEGADDLVADEIPADRGDDSGGSGWERGGRVVGGYADTAIDPTGERRGRGSRAEAPVDAAAPLDAL
jgi:hypothetical protein